MTKRLDDPENRYLSLDIPGTNMFAQAKIDDEGVVLDILKKKGEDIEVVKSTYLMYDEIGAELNFVEE